MNNQDFIYSNLKIKCQEWCDNFRNLIADTITIQNRILRKLVKDDKELQLKILELSSLNQRFRLMFEEQDFNYEKIKQPLNLIFMELSKAYPEPGFIALERESLLNIAGEILSKQRYKIVKLNTNSPLI